VIKEQETKNKSTSRLAIMKYSSSAQVTNTPTKQYKIKKTNLSINKRLKTIQPVTKQLVALGQV